MKRNIILSSLQLVGNFINQTSVSYFAHNGVHNVIA